MEHDFKKLKMDVIQTMITAHSAIYGRLFTIDEKLNCSNTIHHLRLEIAIRKIKDSQLGLPKSA